MSNDPIVIKHRASGASVTVRPFGATITSFLNSKGHETLFVSSLSKTDGSKATRGGIPLVFPQFGQPNKDMPQHGFLRNNYWKSGEVFDNEEEAGCEFSLSLKDVVHARGDGIWKDENVVNCTVTLSVTVTANCMTTELLINNTGQKTFDYQTLFHTYFKIYGSKALDKEFCNVTGLAGYQVYDQITKEDRMQSEDPIFVDRELDCIFTAPAAKPTIDIVLCTGDDGSKVSIKASASVDGNTVPVSAVVWNPFIEKSKGMGDFADTEYHDMICVEPGVLLANQKLRSGKRVFFMQKLSTL